MRSIRAVGSAVAVLLTALLPAHAEYAPVLVYPTEQAFLAAIAPLRQAAEREPKNAEARYRLAYAYAVAWHLWRLRVISYGANYDRLSERELRAAIDADPNHLGAHLLLYELYQSRQDWGAAERLLPRLLALTRDLDVLSRGLRPAPTPPPQPAPPRPTPAPSPIPERPPAPADARFRAIEYFVIVDLDNGLIYRLNCPELPPIERGRLFLIKWQAIAAGYRPATGPCAP